MQSKLCKRDAGGGAGGLSLPEDIIFEVLLRLPLPPAALRRYRCVCKAWRAVISDPSFLAARRSHVCAADPLIVAMFGSAPEFELRLLDRDGNVLRVFDVGGGTAALLAPTRLDLVFVDRMQLGAMIIDPASGRHCTVVGTNDDDDPTPLRRDPWHEPTTSTAVNDYSFGRAVPSGDYKVVRLHVIVTSHGDGRRRRSQWCEVATILDDGGAGDEPTWRRRPWGPFYHTSFSCEHKATVNGDLFFMLYDTYDSESHGRNLIATFNLESEEWKTKAIKGPLLGRKNVQDKWSIALTEIKGTLCMVHKVQQLSDFGGHYANLWLLKDANRSVWVKEYKIQMPQRLLFTKPLDVLLDGTLLLLNTFQKAGNNKKCHRYILQFYNSSTKAFIDFMEMAEGFNGRMAFYAGSLQS
jgi:F-box interacting protein